MLIQSWCGRRLSGNTQKENSPQKCADSPECAGDPAFAVVAGVVENRGIVVGPGLVRVAAQTPSAVLLLPTP
jgi:hypothetical protein